MKLDSARALKQRIVAGEGSAAARAFAKRDIGSGPVPGVAVGIAVTRPGAYGIAVRVRDRTPSASAKDFVAYVRDAAFDEVDVRTTGPIRPLAAPPPLQRGDSIRLRTGSSGTLGCFVRCRRSAAVGILSNNHVIANENLAAPGDGIVQLATAEGEARAGDIVATLDRYVRIEPGERNRVDAAFAVLADGVEFEKPLGLVGVGDPAEAGSVEKIGAATGHTQGWVDAFELDGVVVEYPALGRVTFDGVVEVRGSGAAFSGPGDSGSLIVGEDGHGVALLFAGTIESDPLTYAAPLADVLRELDTDLLTTGSAE